MRSTISSALLCLALLIPFVGQSQGPEQGIIPGDILIMLTPEGKASSVAADLRSLNGLATGMRVEQEVSEPMRIWLLKFDHTAVAQERMLAAVKRHPMVMLAQNDHPVEERQVPNDPQYSQQWHHQNIDSETAWGYSTGGLTATGDTIVVCVIEGANTQHTDLSANRWFNREEIPNNGIDDDGNGYVDDYRGWNPGGNNDNVYNGNHGTQVAGMIGAVGDNGVNGVGANWNVKIMVVTYASASQANVIAAYTYPLTMRRRYNASNGERGAFVVSTNASWGINNANPDNYPLWCAIYDTLGTAGILNCGATSNSNVNVDVVGDMPTACASDFMVSVTATNVQDNRTFSAYGLTTIDVGAPGDNVFTTTQTSGFGSTSGTSFASPLTAGVIGLLYSAPCPTLMSLVNSDPSEGALYIRQVLFEGVDIVGNLQGQTVTGGRINAGNSMELIMNSCGPCPAPYGGLATAQGSGQAQFTWNALAEGPFNVRYRAVGDDEWIDEEAVDPTYLATSLDPCVAYEFQVEMLCDGESSGYSASTVLNPPVIPVPVISYAGREVICASAPVVLSTNATVDVLWSTGSMDASITVQESGVYTVTANGPCNSETSIALEFTVLDPQVPTAEDVILPGPGSAELSADGENIVWYNVPVGGSVVGSGNVWETPYLPSSTSFWVASSEDSETVLLNGGAAARTTTGQFHTNASFWQLFTANEPFVIRSVKVYANGAGNRAIGLINAANNAVITQATFAIPTGESRVELNFAVPGPGNYGLRVMSGDPQLWRDGIGSSLNYPYPLGNLGTITSSSATGTNATALYYFFYDWEVESDGITCESERVQVNVSMPVGIADATAADGIAVYPNPADDILYLELSGALAGQRLQVQVLDNTGRVVREGSITTDRTALNTANFAGGLYVYRLVDAAGVELVRGRFVVAH